MITITDYDTFETWLLTGSAVDDETDTTIEGDFDYLVSIVDSPKADGEEIPPPAGSEFWDQLPADMILRLSFDDVQKDLHWLGRSAPREEHVAALIEFARSAEALATVIIHCSAGASRSPAAGLVWLAARGVDPRTAAELVKKVRPASVPHRLFVEMADKLLRMEGRLLSARDLVWQGRSEST